MPNIGPHTGTTLAIQPHPAARRHAQEVRSGQMSRREFLSRATALGVSAGAAYGLLGLAAPRSAQARHFPEGRPGGTLRIQMNLVSMRDPTVFDWSELANFCRGWLEWLVEYQPDGTIIGRLLESWEANEDATGYTLNLRRGVTWNNGDAFTAADVLHNFTRWCDGSIEGNSMAGRLGVLRDPETGRLRDGAVEIVDDHTVRLHLSSPDITIIPSVADYTAAVVHRSFTGGDPVAEPIGTGPYLPESYDTGISAVLVRNEDHEWWGEGAYLDRIEFVDLGTDPSAWLAAAEGGEIDMVYQSTGDFIDLFDAIGMTRSDAVTASTLSVRFNQDNPPFDNVAVRRALQLATDNRVVLELGYADRGEPAENHHVAPIHPEYAELPPLEVDPAAARAAIEAEGLGDHEFELISVDVDWEAATCDAIAAQIRDAGLTVRRTVLPGATFWNDWTAYPWSATAWVMRPLGVQVLALAFRSGEPWNESAFANEEFDTLLSRALAIADADERRELSRRLQEIMQEEGVAIQPYWRSVYRHARPHVRNAEMHPTFEMHLYQYWLDA
ncbi:MAG: ABC transporter substrate-binding protein [Alkalilacustris sp.]